MSLVTILHYGITLDLCLSGPPCIGGYNFSLGTTGPSDMCQYVSPEDVQLACLRHQADTNNGGVPILCNYLGQTLGSELYTS